MQKFSRKFKTGASAVAVLVVLFGVYGFRKLQALAADPTGEKNCAPAEAGEQGKIDSNGSRRSRRRAQRGRSSAAASRCEPPNSTEILASSK